MLQKRLPQWQPPGLIYISDIFLISKVKQAHNASFIKIFKNFTFEMWVSNIFKPLKGLKIFCYLKKMLNTGLTDVIYLTKAFFGNKFNKQSASNVTWKNKTNYSLFGFTSTLRYGVLIIKIMYLISPTVFLV